MPSIIGQIIYIYNKKYIFILTNIFNFYTLKYVIINLFQNIN
jgi:hypothetical protein